MCVCICVGLTNRNYLHPSVCLCMYFNLSGRVLTSATLVPSPRLAATATKCSASVAAFESQCGPGILSTGLPMSLSESSAEYLRRREGKGNTHNQHYMLPSAGPALSSSECSNALNNALQRAWRTAACLNLCSRGATQLVKGISSSTRPTPGIF